jgi:S-adenosylmethionine:tRNA ribosyltransferase-isomerase
MYSLSDYDYSLPPERIAHQPTSVRDHSRLLVLNRRSGSLNHRVFTDIISFIEPKDVLVVNNTAVIPARLFGTKQSGGKVEVLVLDYAGGQQIGGRFVCQCLVKAAKAPRIGSELFFGAGLSATVQTGHSGEYTLAFDCEGLFEEKLHLIGHVPLPPYIKRESAASYPEDRSRYQTVYAEHKGAVAAPTAGLHFSKNLMSAVANKGASIATLTLHVGYGTFLPVRVSDIREHHMYAERFVISPIAAEQINTAKREGGRVIAVGTTCVRTLEYTANEFGAITPGSGTCDLFIYPGYRFNLIDGLITNFHLPKSTLLMLVAAFAGRENILNAYHEAILEKYRFYSYGDAMLIL